MEDKLREHIKNNLNDLVRLVDYNTFLNGCLKTPHLLTHEMCINLENVDAVSEKLSPEDLKLERHKRLWEKLTHRGPNAYQQIKSLLSALGYTAALQILDILRDDETNFVSISSNKRGSKPDERKVVREPLKNIEENETDGAALNKQDEDEAELKEFNNWDSIKAPKYEVIKSKKLYDDLKVGSYSMKSKDHRGVLFMVNVIDFPAKKDKRNGASEDTISLLHLFKALGFKLFSYVNLTHKNFFRLLDTVLSSEFTRKAECFVLILMTHGNSGNHIQRVQFHDGAQVKVKDIEDRFDNNQCLNLVNKPKILIFPFCRGNVSEKGYLPRIQSDGIGTVKKYVPVKSDMMICYASMPGFMAHRDPFVGSWYIQQFCELMAKNAHDTDFDSIIKLIQRQAGEFRSDDGDMQTGNYINLGFNKQLYFNPGVWEEKEIDENAN